MSAYESWHVEALVNGAWLDLTRFADTEVSPVTSVVGRPSGFDVAESGGGSMVLTNAVVAARFPTLTFPFDGTVSNGWGPPFSTSGGAASDYSVGSGVGVQSHNSVNVLRYCMTDLGGTDMRVRATVSLAVSVATGAPITAWVAGRMYDPSNYYAAVLNHNTGGDITLSVHKRVAGALTANLVPTVTLAGSYGSGAQWTVLLEVCGPTVRAKAWPAAGTEPTAWTLTASDTSLDAGTNAALASRLEGGNTNTQPVLVSWDDLTAFDPWAAGHRFTPGYTASPLYPWWREAVQVRVFEVIGTRRFDIAAGYLRPPEIEDWAESGDQLVTVPFVDRLERAADSRTMVSTLGEHILYVGGSLLKAYYPLGETGGSVFRDYFAVQSPFVVERSDSSIADLAEDEPTFTPAGGTGPAGDDLAPLLFTPVTVPYGNTHASMIKSYRLKADYQNVYALNPPPAITLHAGELLTLVCWLTLDANVDDNDSVFFFTLFDAGFTTTTYFLLDRHTFLNTVTDPGLWSAVVSSVPSGLDGGVTNGLWTYVGGAPIMVGIQMGYSPNSLRLWLDTDEFVAATPTGTVTDPQRLYGQLGVGSLAGSVSHLQVYVGNFTHQMFLDQRDMGLTGLAGQRSDERIRTVANYARITDADLDLDVGNAYLQRASLAGRKPLEVMQAANETERGRLFVAGDGRLTAHNRVRTSYNL